MPKKTEIPTSATVELTREEYLVLCDATDILTDGFWDDPEEPGHTENTVRWANLMRKVRNAFRRR